MVDGAGKDNFDDAFLQLPALWNFYAACIHDTCILQTELFIRVEPPRWIPKNL